MGDGVDVHALGLRDAVDRGAVMVLILGPGKAGGPPIARRFIPQTSSGPSGPGAAFYWVYRVRRPISILRSSQHSGNSQISISS